MKIIECPRDAMQGLHDFIPTKVKVAYINQLLKVGFDTIDFGSFVSPKAIPQMKDTPEVLEKLDRKTNTKLLAIVANVRGAEMAVMHETIDFVGYPFSISETFQQRNTNSSIAQSLGVIEKIQSLCTKNNKKLVAYISMGFGNPYKDPYSEEIVLEFTDKLSGLGITIISLSDTIGVSTPEQIESLFRTLYAQYPEIEFGAHLHSTPATSLEKIAAAYNSGCRRFDGAIKGFGGCPMAKDELTGNMATEKIIDYLISQNDPPSINLEEFKKSVEMAMEVFPS